MRRIFLSLCLALSLFCGQTQALVEIGPFVQAVPVVPINQVVINDLSDLPAPSAGVIQLADYTHYIIAANISGSDRIVLGIDNTITCNSVFSPCWAYTGSGNMFTGVDVNVHILNVRLNCPNGTVFDMSSPTASGGNIFYGQGIIIESCAKVGHFNNINTVDISSGTAANATIGITVAGNTNWSIFSFDKWAMFSSSATFIGIDFGTSLHKTLELNDLVIRAPAGAIGLKGAADSANLVTGALATVTNGEFSGGLTPLSVFDTCDIRWNYKANSGIPDSVSDFLMSFNGNTTATTIAFVNTPVKVNAVWTVERSSRFTCTTTGRATFIAERDDFFPLDLAIGLISVGGTPIDATAYIAINGSVIANSGISVAISGSDQKSISIPWQKLLSEDDYGEIFVENNTNDNNIIVESSIFRGR